MKTFEKHIKKIKKEGDEMAWILMNQAILEYYSESHEAHKNTLNEFNTIWTENNDEISELNQLGEQLLDTELHTISQLTENAQAYEDLSEQYQKYDELKLEHMNLLARLAAEKENLKNKLAANLENGLDSIINS